LPVIVRLIDPPLHEFLPGLEELIEEVATKKATGDTDGLEARQQLLESVRDLHESNPMMGLRGVRLSILMPEIVEMQVRAIFEAAANKVAEGIDAKPEVMIPLTGHVNELKAIQPRLVEIAREAMEAKDVSFPYKFGTMIEIPRAALTAPEIAGVAEFFSYGTNDLTQMTFGYSRDDAERNFLIEYVEPKFMIDGVKQGILPNNPFQTIDPEGVGRLMEIGTREGRSARPDLEVGICGEHGGDPASIQLCHRIGLNYVSCSPFRVPIARLSAAHAALGKE
jgi:pyruvate,orthophosphate dikinase